jgi:putative nucleotidyltransferase with HDIG domain
MPNRQDAWDLVCKYTKNINLRRHMLAVEAGMRAYARRFGEDEERWALVGLVHDFDYEQNPDVATDGHPNTGAPILRERGYDETVVRAVLSHATEVTGVERRTPLEHALYAVDDLTVLRRISGTSRLNRLRRSGRIGPSRPAFTGKRSRLARRPWE